MAHYPTKRIVVNKIIGGQPKKRINLDTTFRYILPSVLLFRLRGDHSPGTAVSDGKIAMNFARFVCN